MMKYFSALLIFFAVYVCSALGQEVTIGAPAPGSTLVRGQTYTVELDTSDSIAQIQQVSACIGLADSSTSPGSLGGTLLTCGPYNPQKHEVQKPFYQNYSVTIPTFVPTGTTQLNVLHLFLAGADYSSVLEFKNITVVIG